MPVRSFEFNAVFGNPRAALGCNCAAQLPPRLVHFPLLFQRGSCASTQIQPWSVEWRISAGGNNGVWISRGVKPLPAWKNQILQGSYTTASVQSQETTLPCEHNPLQQWLVRLSIWEYFQTFSDAFHVFLYSPSSAQLLTEVEGKPGFFVLRGEQQKEHRACSVTCPSTDRSPSFYNNFWYKRNRVTYRYIIQEILYFPIKCLSTFAL